MTITRRSFLAGLGSVSVGFLFHRHLDRVLDSLEHDLVEEPPTPSQLPAAAEIVVHPQATFQPKRLVVPYKTAPLFLIEDIHIDELSQIAPGSSVPAELFLPHLPGSNLMLTTARSAIRFRVRYIGKDPRGARFQAALFGTRPNEPGEWILPIDSGREIAA
jgi:hypothetical protein